MPVNEKWWGEFTIPLYHARTWRLGPLELQIARLPGEWRLLYKQEEDPFLNAGDLSEAFPLTSEGHPPNTECMRFGVHDRGERIRITPMLADRSILSRPATPFLLPGGEHADLYVTSPLWINIAALEPERVLLEQPTFRPKDSWLGANTMQGLLCYGSRDATHASLDDIEFHPVRAISRIRISNTNPTTVQLPRVLLPTGLLSLFVDAKDCFWTQELSVQLGREVEPVLGKGAPQEAGEVRVVSTPRDSTHPHHLLSALGGMLG